MAAEYSRELSVKVFAGQSRLIASPAVDLRTRSVRPDANRELGGGSSDFESVILGIGSPGSIAALERQCLPR